MTLLEIVTLKYHLHATFWDDFFSSHISREDLLTDRTSFRICDLRILVHVYLMFVVYRTKRLTYNLFFRVRACVCLCIYSLLCCNAYLFHIICIGSKSSYGLSRSFSQNIYDTFAFTELKIYALSIEQSYHPFQNIYNS